MTIANVTAATAITAVWGNSVADAINDINDNFPLGVKAYATASGTDQTGIDSTPEAITGLAVSFTAATGRIYKASLNVTSSQVTADGNQTLALSTDDGTVAARTITVATGDTVSWCMVERFTASSAGTFTVDAFMSTDAGTVTIVNSFTRNATLVVEDIGPVLV